jgi:hypothetical protein
MKIIFGLGGAAGSPRSSNAALVSTKDIVAPVAQPRTSHPNAVSDANAVAVFYTQISVKNFAENAVHPAVTIRARCAYWTGAELPCIRNIGAGLTTDFR